MIKIPVKEAIAAQAWLECRSKVRGEEVHYRVRMVAFDRTSVEEISPSRVDKVRVEGILWLLRVEVVNLRSTPTEVWLIKESITLIDEDGFEFTPFNSDLDGDVDSGLHKFFGGRPFPPEIEASGSIAFNLPDETTNYYLALKDGKIREV